MRDRMLNPAAFDLNRKPAYPLIQGACEGVGRVVMCGYVFFVWRVLCVVHFQSECASDEWFLFANLPLVSLVFFCSFPHFYTCASACSSPLRSILIVSLHIPWHRGRAKGLGVCLYGCVVVAARMCVGVFCRACVRSAAVLFVNFTVFPLVPVRARIFTHTRLHSLSRCV